MTTDELAFRAAIIADPAADLPRLVYADWLEEQAGRVVCGRCRGGRCGYGPKIHEPGCTCCLTCSGTGSVSDGRAERAAFMRVQIAAARFDTFDPTHRKEFNEAARVRLAARMSRLERGESESLKIARAVEQGGKDYAQQRDALRRRESDLLGRWGRVWCGFDANYVNPPAGAMFDPRLCTVVEFRKGFVHTVRGPLAAFWGPCGACAGQRFPGYFGDDSLADAFSIELEGRRCPRCSGTGSGPTPAFRALVRREPVERVEMTDREPYTHLANEYWWICAPEYGGDQTTLPRELWSWMASGARGRRAANVYESPSVARDALSAALLKAARGTADAAVPG